MPLTTSQVMLSVIIGTLAAIVYSLRILVLIERRVGRMEKHIEKVVEKIIKEETNIEKMISKKKK